MKRPIKEIVMELADAKLNLRLLKEELAASQKECTHSHLVSQVCVDCYLLVTPVWSLVD